MEIPVEEAPPLVAELALTPSQRRRAVTAATLGNGLEFYDFITFTFFAIQIGNSFFPSQNHFLSLMGSLATFGAGFITRPIGAHFLGGYADHHGRKPAMLISMSLMGLGITLLAITPSYATIGVAAPIIAVCARLIQGFALGGEVGSATVYMMESAKAHRRAFTMGWQGASQNVAATVGSLVGLILASVISEADLSSYGWRIALLLGVTIVPVALWVRASLPETLHGPDTTPVENIGFRGYMRPILLGFVIIASGTIATYIFNYMATYGQNTLHLSATISLAAEFGGNGISIAVILFGGWMSDRHGRRSVMIIPQLLFCLAIVPCFLWLTTERDAFSFIGANVIIGILSTYPYGAAYAAITESLPKEVRARAFALVYAIPVAAFGGTTQLVVTWLLQVTGAPMAIAWDLTAISVIGLIAMLGMRESAPVKLERAAAIA
jgi:MHS family citrate/tricarballylate:H+ symporter-like MFS transporter